MNTGARRCTDCSSETTTEEALEKVRSQRRKTTVSTVESPQPENKQSGATKPTNTTSSEDNDIKAPGEASNDESIQLYTQPRIPKEVADLLECPVFAMGWYDAESYKHDEYSRRLIALAKDQDQGEVQKFASHLKTFLKERTDKLSADAITLYPRHAGGVSDALVDTVKVAIRETKIEYQQYLRRTEKRPRQRDQDYEKRWSNQRGSITVEGDVTGKTVFLVDDIVTSGASIAVGAHHLLNSGADQVIGICLGLSSKQSWAHRLSDPSHTITSVIESH